MDRHILTPYIALLRVKHWFKNLFLLVGVIAAVWQVNGVSQVDPVLIVMAILLASLVSSVNYVINQLADIEFDAKHQLKKKRPLPSGQISVTSALAFAAIIFLVSILLSIKLFPQNFTLTLIALWVAGILYNVRPIRLKDILYLDVISESINNPIRFLLGWFMVIPSSFPPTLLLLITWSAGAILMTGKRYDELKVLGKKLVPYRKSFRFYSLATLRNLMFIYTGITLVCFLALTYIYKWDLLYAFPFVAVFLFWIVRNVLTGAAQARLMEGFMLKRNFLVYSLLLCCLITFLIFK